MNSTKTVIEVAILAALGAPAALLGALSVSSLVRREPSERLFSLLSGATLALTLAAVSTAFVVGLRGDALPQTVSLGAWFSFGTDAFSLDFLVDAPALGFAMLAIATCGVASAFASRYLHQEPGFHRYFVQMSLFVLGITLVSFAGSIDVLLAGWEVVGLSSALLVGFFHERRGPVRNALRVFAFYRVGDAAMLCAAVLLHHWTGSGTLVGVFGDPAALALDSGKILVIAVLILVAVAGKSALLPFSGWLPRAMEGPTTSSAIYYGALSIHAGCFLLLRAEPLFAMSRVAQALAVVAGVTTAVYATLTARVQADIKSALVYACLTQVGLIVVEIALGFTTVAFVHIVGHTCFRLLQFLSAPNVLHDLHELENRVGGHAFEGTPRFAAFPRASRALYLASLERGFTDSLLDRLVVEPFLYVAGRLDALDRWMTGSREGGSAPLPRPGERR